MIVHVCKKIIDYDKDYTYVAMPLLKLSNNFTIVTEEIKSKNASFFEQTFEGFLWNSKEDT